MEYFKQAWNYVHFLGSALLFLLVLIFVPFWWAVGITFTCGLLWECLDEWNYYQVPGKKMWFLDPQGFDWRDLIMDAVGIVAGLILGFLLAL